MQVRPEKAQRVMEIANEHHAFSPTSVRAERPGGEPYTMIFVNVPNRGVGDFIWAVREEVEDAQFVIFPYGSLPVQTPVSEVRQRLQDVSQRSTLELVVGSLQSLGSWKGLLLYALFSGVVAAYGLIVNASYLLVAAMLIAPMGAPGMVAVVGTTIGDWRMAGRGTLRFVVAIVVLVVTAVALGFAYGLGASTSMMEQVTALSSFTVLLTLVAGAAGAQSQVQSERASLVTGTATGFLIAAALSPTSAVLGLAIPLGRWDYVGLMAFQLALQFVSLLAGGWLALLLYGVRPGDPTVGRGSQLWRAVLAGAAVAAVVGLTVLQLRRGPRFVKADLARQAVAMARSTSEGVGGVRLLEADAHFTRPDLRNRAGEALLINLVVQDTARVPEARLQSAIRNAMRRRVGREMPGVVPYVNVTILPGEGR